MIDYKIYTTPNRPKMLLRPQTLVICSSSYAGRISIMKSPPIYLIQLIEIGVEKRLCIILGTFLILNGFFSFNFIYMVSLFHPWKEELKTI